MNDNQKIVRKSLLELLGVIQMDPIQLCYEFMLRGNEGLLGNEVATAYVNLSIPEVKQVVRELVIE